MNLKPDASTLGPWGGWGRVGARSAQVNVKGVHVSGSRDEIWAAAPRTHVHPHFSHVVTADKFDCVPEILSRPSPFLSRLCKGGKLIPDTAIIETEMGTTISVIYIS